MYANDRQRATNGGIRDESAENSQESEQGSPTPDADGSGDDCDPDPPATGAEAGGEEGDGSEAEGAEDVPGWKEYGYPRKPKWAPDCPRCGGPILLVTIAGPGVSQITPCGCKMAPSEVEIL
ncbi:hypothetical protein [Halovivax cerinus]|uniref:hypothetical protein n=1 Tax=Halovivax cerinus TaxID=1487865 RepID=UPI0036D2200D